MPLQSSDEPICSSGFFACRFLSGPSPSWFSLSPLRHANASYWTVELGRLSLNGPNSFSVTLGVRSIVFSNLTGDNIAVLMLSSSTRISAYIQPICVDQGTVDFLNNTDCWIAGWARAREAVRTPHPEHAPRYAPIAESPTDSVMGAVSTRHRFFNR